MKILSALLLVALSLGITERATAEVPVAGRLQDSSPPKGQSPHKKNHKHFMLELDFRRAGVAEISFFGFVTELTGKGHGGWLMAHALSIGWRKDIERMWVHSCTLDHPGALGFYRRHGFAPFERAIETFADPRLAGILPRDAASHIPLLDQAPATLR